MEYTVRLSDEVAAINFAPSNVLEEVIQNIRNICLSIKGSIPYQRDMGFDEEIVDLPADKAVMIFQIDTIKQMKKYEPRAKIKQFDYSGSDVREGILTPTLIIEIDEKYL